MSATSPSLKIVSWNVNGLRTLGAWRPTTATGPVLAGVLKELDGDIVCFQETKLTRKQQCLELAEEADPAVWVGCFSLCEAKQGYSGTATFCRRDRATPLTWWDSLEGLETNNGNGIHLDREGRCVITDHGEFILINVYCPNAASAQRMVAQLDFLLALEQMCKKLVLGQGRQVIIAGDINCSMHPIDTCDVRRSILDHSELLRDWAKDPLCLMATATTSAALIRKCYDKLASGEKMDFEDFPVRQWMIKLIEIQDNASCVKFLDAFRTLHPNEEGAFTCWNMRVNGREGNYGTRIDYILLSLPKLAGKLKECFHLRNFKGSDHCPVVCILSLDIPNNSELPDDTATATLLKEKAKQKKLSSFFLTNTSQLQELQESSQLSALTTVSQVNHKSEPAPSSSQSLLGVIRKGPSSARSGPSKASKMAKVSSGGLERFGFVKKAVAVVTTQDDPFGAASQSQGDHPMSEATTSQSQMSCCSQEDMPMGQDTDNAASSARTEETMTPSQTEELLGGSAPSPSGLSGSWKSLLNGTPQIPLCKHQEKCELRTVTKKGSNNGREFYVCKYPTHVHKSNSGGSSSKEVKESCGFFQWVKQKQSSSKSKSK